MKPILLATDGSPYAAEATLEAFQLARRLGAPLLAITVANIVVPPYAYDGYAEAVRKLMDIEDERVSTVLAETKAAADAAGLECEHRAGLRPRGGGDLRARTRTGSSHHCRRRTRVGSDPTRHPRKRLAGTR